MNLLLGLGFQVKSAQNGCDGNDLAQQQFLSMPNLLLVLTEFSGIALFTDKLTSDTITNNGTAFDWLGMLNGTVGMTSVTVYGRKLNDVLVLLTDSQTFENQFPSYRLVKCRILTHSVLAT